MILLLESLHPEAEALLERCEPVLRAVEPNRPVTPSPEVHAILTRGRGQITDAVMGSFPALKAIARAGAGLDNLDTAAAARRNIKVIFAHGINSRTVAEHTLALMLSLVRQITPWALPLKRSISSNRALTSSLDRALTWSPGKPSDDPVSSRNELIIT